MKGAQGKKAKKRSKEVVGNDGLCTVVVDCLDTVSECESEHALDLSAIDAIQSSDETVDDSDCCCDAPAADKGLFPISGNTPLFDIVMPMVRQMPADMFTRLVVNWQILGERSALEVLGSGSGCTGLGLDWLTVCTMSEVPTLASCVVHFELDRGPVLRPCLVSVSHLTVNVCLSLLLRVRFWRSRPAKRLPGGTNWSARSIPRRGNGSKRLASQSFSRRT